MLPLEGIRVVDFSWAMAGPQATRLLADLGADVIRVESSVRPDLARSAFGPHPFGREEFGLDSSAYFNHFNRNKRSLALDMSKPQAREVVRDLVAVSDVVLENYSAGVLAGWGFDYEALRSIRPDIIYVSMAGPGHRGPYSDHRTFGPTVQALSGLTHLSGLPDEPPAGWGFSYMDHSGGYAGATAVMIALYRRDRTGEGEWVDLSQIEAAIALTGTAILDAQVNKRRSVRTGNRSPQAAPHGVYRCLDESGRDRWVAIACYSDDQWDTLRGELGSPGWADGLERAAARLDRQEEIDKHLSEFCSGRRAHDVQRTLQAVGIPAGVVQNNQDLDERDEQAEHRGTYPFVTHKKLGTLRTDGLPIRLSKTPGGVRGPAPLLGEHTADVLKDLLGYSDARVASLRDAEVLR